MKSSEVCSVCPGQICVALNSLFQSSAVSLQGFADQQGTKPTGSAAATSEGWWMKCDPAACGASSSGAQGDFFLPSLRKIPLLLLK